jgi:hypothetical protein
MERSPEVVQHKAANRAAEDDHTTSIPWLKLGVVDALTAEAGKLPESNPKPAVAAPHRTFSCNYCMRKFFSSQALGGHQNAHRRERTLARRAVRLDAFPYGYADVASLPLYGAGLYPIGIQAHASVHHHHPGVAAPAGRAELRSARALLGPMPFFVQAAGDEDASFGWPGSFRPPPTAATTIPAAAAAPVAVNSGSSNSNHGGSVVVQAAADEPDLTLRL